MLKKQAIGFKDVFQHFAIRQFDSYLYSSHDQEADSFLIQRNSVALQICSVLGTVSDRDAFDEFCYL